MNSQETLFKRWITKYKPYWPIFLLLTCILMGISCLYIYYALPRFQSTASLIIKDEKKGNDDSRIMESLNLLGSKKIIENEIEVLRSRPVIESVVKKLHLYSEVFIQKKFKETFLYEDAPILVEAFDLSTLKSSHESLAFTINESKKIIHFSDNNLSYPLNSWTNTPFGLLKFSLRKSNRLLKKDEKYSLRLINIKSKVNGILSDLKVTSSNKLSSIIELKYRDKDPKLAEIILNEIITSYNVAAVAEKNILAKNTLQFIEERLNIVGGELNEIESKIQQYKSNEGAIDISTQGKLYLENVSNNDQRLSEINLQLSVINTLEKNISEQSRSAGSHTIVLSNADPVFTQLLSSLNSAELEREKLKKTVAENNPMLVSVSDQISKIKDNIYKNIVDQRKNLEAAKKNILETNSSYTALLQAIPSKERELLEISRDQQIKSGIYSFLLQKREESELSYVSNLSDSRVINYAQSNPIPVAPNKMIIFGLAFFAIWIIPAGSIAIKETFNNTILYRKDIEGLSKLPLIGEVTHHRNLKPLAIEPGKRSYVAEEFRRIRYAMHYFLPKQLNKKILVTSNLSGEGKSFVTSNLAISFSLSGKKVALLDFDLHNSSLEKIFFQQNKSGITDYLEGTVSINDIIFPVEGYPMLSFIPKGMPSNDPSILIESERLRSLFTILEDSYDLIILDSPPVALVSDAYQLSQYCAATLFVIRHGYTPMQLIKRLDESISVNPLNNPLLIFNGVKNRGFVADENGYGYKYSSGYKNYYTS